MPVSVPPHLTPETDRLVAGLEAALQGWQAARVTELAALEADQNARRALDQVLARLVRLQDALRLGLVPGPTAGSSARMPEAWQGRVDERAWLRWRVALEHLALAGSAPGKARFEAMLAGVQAAEALAANYRSWRAGNR